MKTYSAIDSPLQVFGIPFFDAHKRFERLPEPLRKTLPSLSFAGVRCPGARIGFRTNATEFTVRVQLKTLTPDIGMSIYGCQSVSVMIGDRQNAVFAGLVNPKDYDTMEFEKTFKKSSKTEEVTLWLLRNEAIEAVSITVSDDAVMLPPTPYKYGPAVFYGSSITEGGCCTGVTNSYTALLSRWLDLDYYNLGFSGNAKGEPEVAEFINTMDMRLFIMDYDHNAPTVSHLRDTHAPFFKAIREKNPSLPILLLSRPNFDSSEDGAARRAVIEETYHDAVRAGDANVYYIDGETLFGETDRQLCTVDTIHPNDLGFYRMAKTMLPVIKNMLHSDAGACR